MMGSHIGELAALGAAACWALNAVAFESAGKDVGSLSVNYIRLIMAFTLVSAMSLFSRGILFPVDATAHSWRWLSLSGLFGFVLGDAFLFQAFVDIGSRTTLLIASAAPPLTLFLGWAFLHEKVTWLNWVGVIVIMVGISMVILSRNPAEEKVKFNRPLKGIGFASLGALGQSLGLISSKLGMGTYNVFATTQIRLIAAIISVTVMVTAKAKWPELKAAISQKKAMREIAIGAILGPFIGVSLSLVALKNTASGIVSSITSVSPVIVIPATTVFFKEKVPLKEILGAIVTIAGVVILFL